MDLGTIINRVLLDYYKYPIDFWRDVGLVWRNCRKFNEEKDSDMKMIGEVLREASIVLYRQWWRLTRERYEGMVGEFGSAREQREREGREREEREREKVEVEKEAEKKIETEGEAGNAEIEQQNVGAC